VRHFQSRGVVRPAPETFAPHGFGGEPQPADGARPVALRLRVPAVGGPAAKRRPPGLTLPPGKLPLQLLWLGEGSRSELERGLPEQDRELVLENYWETGASRSRGRPAARPCCPEGHLPAGEPPHPLGDLLRQALEQRGIAAGWVSKADLFSRAKGAQAVLQRFALMSACLNHGTASGGGAFAGASPLAWAEPRNDRPGTGPAPGSRWRSGLVRLSAIATTAACWRPSGTDQCRGHGRKSCSAAGSSPTCKQGAELVKEHALGAP